MVGFGLIGFYAFFLKIDSSFVTLASSISIACLGFLPFNMPKARVFMGDVGSILLGFVFAGMVVFLSRNLLDFICMAGFLFPFYADHKLCNKSFRPSSLCLKGANKILVVEKIKKGCKMYGEHIIINFMPKQFIPT